MVIATKLSFPESVDVFDDPKMATALQDRLTHRYHFLVTGNESYRFRNLATDIKKKNQNPGPIPS